jgi:hypothetical protein
VTYTGTPPHRQIVSRHFGLLVPTDNAGWVALANANIAVGRPVRPVFKKFTVDEAWHGDSDPEPRYRHTSLQRFRNVPDVMRQEQQRWRAMSVRLSAIVIDDGSSEPRMP